MAAHKKTPVYERGLHIFRDEVCHNPRIKDRLLQMLLELIQRERQGAMIERGLLKTEDVLNKGYVDEMERRLRQQAATKIAEGRDVRYSRARAAYRAPVNVTTTATPGVYRYQRPRFLRPAPIETT